MDCIVHGVTQSRTQLSNFHFDFTSLSLSAVYVLGVCTQLCPTLLDPMDCSSPRSSVHGIFQARILERVAISSSREVCS